MISDKKAVQDLVSLLWQKGIHHIVISAGSRNAPLTISFNNYQNFNCYAIPDERSAGYFALGLAQSIKQPVAMVCTSGTALLNYGPAIAEAYYQNIPLIAISSDRPEEYIDQGEGQSIRQVGALKNHTKKQVALRRDVGDKLIETFNARLINETLNEAVKEPRGPVHINIPFEESLYQTVDFPASFPKVFEEGLIEEHLALQDINKLEEILNSRKKVLILVGMLDPNEALKKELQRLNQLDQVLILTESTSNLGELGISCIDRLIMSFSKEDEKEFEPQVIVTLGNNIISKKIKFLLRRSNSEQHIHIGRGHFIQDTFQKLSWNISMAPENTLSSLVHLKSNDSSYKSKWTSRDSGNAVNAKKYIDQLSFCDLKAVSHILDVLPQNCTLQMGNSSVVRYVQLFNANSSITYHSNRGTSGIDGCTSTAIGYSVLSDSPTYLISGDVSFIYDNNALWNTYLKANLKMIVINNGGGGIFRIIEGPSTTSELEKYFETAHHKSVRPLCEMHQVSYLSANDEDSLSEQLRILKESKDCSLLEIFTDKKINDSALKEMFNFLTKNKN